MSNHALGLLALALAACSKGPTCETDTDCRVSCIVRDSCCETCNCMHPYHKDELEAVRAANQKRCGDDPCHLSCPVPTATWTARCREHRCVAEEVAVTSLPDAPAKTTPAADAPDPATTRDGSPDRKP